MKTTPLLTVLVLSGAIALLLVPRHAAPSAPAPSAPSAPATAEPVPATPPPADSASFAADLAEGLVFPATPLPRPLPVARASGRHEWTEGDARDPAVLHRIAHNPAEFRRLVEENDRILDRQLVYRKETVATVLQAARASGETVRRLTLPALDGHELDVELTGADLAPSALRGTLHGKLVGRPQSMVTIAFKGGREAFTVMSPEDGLHLQADPREPGEIIVKRIDPATYVVGSCGNH